MSARKNEGDRGYGEFIKAVLAGERAPFYLFDGEDMLLAEECVIELQAVLGGEYAYRSFAGGEEEGGLGMMVAEARARDFFSSKKLCYLRGAELSDELELGQLAEYLVAPVEDCVLCAALRGGAGRAAGGGGAEGKGKATGALRRLARAHGVLVSLKAPGERELTGLMARMAKRRGLALDPEATHYLLTASGGEPLFIRDELDKLSLFLGEAKGGQRAVGLEEVRGYVQDMRAGSVFDFTDHLAAKNGVAAMAELARLALDGKEAIRLVGLLAYRYRLLRMVEELQRQGRANDEIAEQLGLGGKMRWLVGKVYKPQVARHKPGELRLIQERLLRLDLSLKRGEGSAAGLVANFVQEVT